jgi:hypothetical protein
MTEPSSPDEGPATAAAVAAWLSKEHGDTATTLDLAPTVAAVNRIVRRWLSPGADGVWGADHEHGAVMLAARLWRRRRSPDGVAAFSGDTVLYVSRNDPDVAMLLQIGPYAPPVVG